MISKIDKNKVRKARHDRMRHYLSGTEDRPRLNVYRSTQHIYAQVINDAKGTTLVSASTLDAEIAAKLSGKSKKEASKLVGELVGRRAVSSGIKKVVFDRGGYIYAGRVAELAQGARDAGLDF